MYYFTVIYFVSLVVSSEEIFINRKFRINTRCEAPRGDICVPIRECPYFDQLLARTSIPRPKYVIKIIREHQCGFHGNAPKVCCSLPPPLTPVPAPESIPQRPDENAIPFYEPPDITDHANVEMLPKDCGPLSASFRITGGTDASLFEFPWMALIVYNTEEGLDYRCGGTVINDRYVITAAHCISNYSLAGVRLGEYNVNTKEDCDPSNDSLCSPPVQDFFIEEIIVHANYNPTYFTDDIALIRLATPADFSKENVKPICMPIGQLRHTDLNGKFATVSGWGITETGQKSATLKKVSVPIVSNAECSSIYGRFSKISAKQICAGGSLGRDSCGGDSGGPLKYVGILDSNPRYVQYGIVSYGPRNCGTPKQPGVYTRLSFYMKWILDNIR